MSIDAFSTCKAVDAGSIPTPASNGPGAPAPSFFLTQSPPKARVVKLVDTRDLKSLDG